MSIFQWDQLTITKVIAWKPLYLQYYRQTQDDEDRPITQYKITTTTTTTTKQNVYCHIKTNIEN